MAKRKYEDVFPDIAKKHKRMELSIFAKIILKVDELLNRKEKVTKTKISRKLNIKRDTIVNKVDTLEDFEYIEQRGRTIKGGNRIFLSIEDEKSVWGWDNQEEHIYKHETLLVERIKKDSRVTAVVDKSLIERFLKLYKMKEYRAALGPYYRIVETLYLKGIKEDTKEVGLHSLALSIFLRFKGEKAVGNPFHKLFFILSLSMAALKLRHICYIVAIFIFLNYDLELHNLHSSFFHIVYPCEV
ncbi:hypothetical protein HYX05_04165 [Candidatus Woesearchaeota archaeon]|nr:hypothetical protein [Candidatus Woesearchaeota archaeon]